MEASNNGSNLWKRIIAIIAAVALVGWYVVANRTAPAAEAPMTGDEGVPATDPSTEMPAADARYKDGTYSATGAYVSPGGAESVGVTLTLVGGIITDASFEAHAEIPISQMMQKVFSENFRPMVVGKPLEGLALSKVSTSSLTPVGFNDALEKIRAEAEIAS